MQIHRKSIASRKIILAVCIVIYSSMFGLSNAYSEYSKLERFALDPFYPAFQRDRALYGHAKQEIIKRFGPPTKEESVIKPDYRDPGGKGIEYSTLYYDGMTIYVETDTTSQIASSSWIKKIHITSPKYNLVYDLSIGTDKNQYIEKLGKKYVGGTYDLDMNPLSYNVSIYESSNGASLHTFHEITIMISPAGKSESITWELGDAD